MTQPAQNRNLNDLHQEFRSRFERWKASAEAKGFRILVVETARTPERQAWLYASGRSRPGKILTQTMDSCHRYKIAADVVTLTAGGDDDWSWAAYDRLYKACPVEPFGLQLLDWERPHIQLAGGQAAAKKLGIVRDGKYTSVWPLPQAPKPAPSEAGGVVVPARGVRVPVYLPGTTDVIQEVTIMPTGNGGLKGYLVPAEKRKEQ